MKLIRDGALFVGLLGVAYATQAQVSSSWTVTNDYDFRGNTQSAKDPALQGSLDYAHSSGWSLGMWGSSIDFGPGDPNLELDVYTGFSREIGNGVSYDVGASWYTYPSETSLNYVELYAGLSKDWFSTKLWYSPKFGGTAAEEAAFSQTGNDSVSAWYVEVNGEWSLPRNLSLLAHLGYSTGDYWDNAFGDDQVDYALGLGYTAGNFGLGLKYVDTSGDVKVRDKLFNNEGRVIFTVATTFPWGE